MKNVALVVSIVMVVVMLAGTAVATPDRAEKTGKSCGECHSKVGKPIGK